MEKTLRNARLKSAAISLIPAALSALVIALTGGAAWFFYLLIPLATFLLGLGSRALYERFNNSRISTQITLGITMGFIALGVAALTFFTGGLALLPVFLWTLSATAFATWFIAGLSLLVGRKSEKVATIHLEETDITEAHDTEPKAQASEVSSTPFLEAKAGDDPELEAEFKLALEHNQLAAEYRKLLEQRRRLILDKGTYDLQAKSAQKTEDKEREQRYLDNAKNCDDQLQKINEALKPLGKKLSAYFSDPRVTRYVTQDKIWMLGVDAKDHPHGREAYDEGTVPEGYAEPGYIDASEIAIAFILKTKGKPLTLDFYNKVYFLFGYGVKDKSHTVPISVIKTQEFEKLHHLNTGIFAFLPQTTTREGLAEIADWIKHLRLKGVPAWRLQAPYLFDKTGNKIFLTSENVDQFYQALPPSLKNPLLSPARTSFQTHRNEAMAQFFGEFYEIMDQQNLTDDEKDLALATLAKKVNLFHPYPDGNIRTIRGILIKLCIEHGLLPTAMDNPNVFDAHSCQQCVALIKAGRDYYKQHIQPGAQARIGQWTAEGRHSLDFAGVTDATADTSTTRKTLDEKQTPGNKHKPNLKNS